MKTRTKILSILGILIIIILFYFSTKQLTGYVIGTGKNSFTMAICNKTTPNGGIYCEDYEIICEGKKASKISATGFSVPHPNNWQDPRGENGSEIICK